MAICKSSDPLASLWFAVTISGKEARKAVTDKWLPAAETACNELLTIGATIERMRHRQIKTCEAIELVFPGVPPKELAPIRQIIRVRCDDCAGILGSLKDHVENSFRNWEVFINNNCEQDECEYIHSRLAERRYMLEVAIQGISSEAILQSVIPDQ